MFSAQSLTVGAATANEIAEFDVAANQRASSVTYLLKRGGPSYSPENTANLRFVAVEIRVRVPGEVSCGRFGSR